MNEPVFGFSTDNVHKCLCRVRAMLVQCCSHYLSMMACGCGKLLRVLRPEGDGAIS